MLFIRLQEMYKIAYKEVKHKKTPKSIINKNKLWTYVTKIVHAERFFSLGSEAYKLKEAFPQNLNGQP